MQGPGQDCWLWMLPVTDIMTREVTRDTACLPNIYPISISLTFPIKGTKLWSQRAAASGGLPWAHISQRFSREHTHKTPLLLTPTSRNFQPYCSHISRIPKYLMQSKNIHSFIHSNPIFQPILCTRQGLVSFHVQSLNACQLYLDLPTITHTFIQMLWLFKVIF